MQKQSGKLNFVQSVNFQSNDSSENNGTKFWLLFNKSCNEVWNSKTFFDVATAGKHGGFSTSYKNHNLFRHSKPGREVEFHKTQIFCLKSPRKKKQLPAIITQLGL